MIEVHEASDEVECRHRVRRKPLPEIEPEQDELVTEGQDGERGGRHVLLGQRTEDGAEQDEVGDEGEKKEREIGILAIVQRGA